MSRYLFLIILLVTLSCSPLKMYQELPEVKAWENEIAKFEFLDKTEQYSSDAIIFAGSSSIRLWTDLAEDMEPFEIIQRGYGGARLSDFAVYADRIFSPHPCSAVVLFIANDITGDEKDKSPEEVKRLFLNVLKTIRRSHPHVPVFWIGITPTSSRWNAWPEISKANDLISEACQNRNNTYFIRTDYAFLNGNGKPRDELFVADKLHLNREGYKLWAQIIKQEIEKVMDKAKSPGPEVYSWPIDDQDEAKRLIAPDVKGIATYLSGWLNEQVGLH